MLLKPVHFSVIVARVMVKIWLHENIISILDFSFFPECHVFELMFSVFFKYSFLEFCASMGTRPRVLRPIEFTYSLFRLSAQFRSFTLRSYRSFFALSTSALWLMMPCVVQ